MTDYHNRHPLDWVAFPEGDGFAIKCLQHSISAELRSKPFDFMPRADKYFYDLYEKNPSHMKGKISIYDVEDEALVDALEDLELLYDSGDIDGMTHSNAFRFLRAIHEIYPVPYHIYLSDRKGVAIDAPMKKGAAISFECAPLGALYCFVAINGKRRRAKYYQMTDLPDSFIKQALQDLKDHPE